MTHVYKDLHVEMPTKYQYLDGTTILTLVYGFFDIIIDIVYWCYVVTYG